MSEEIRPPDPLRGKHDAAKPGFRDAPNAKSKAQKKAKKAKKKAR